MSSFLQADIFFFITSIAVILLTLVSVGILVVLFKIAKRIHSISRTIDEEVQGIKQDIDDLRSGVRDRLETANRSPLIGILGAIVSHAKRHMMSRMAAYGDDEPEEKPKRRRTRKKATTKTTKTTK